MRSFVRERRAVSVLVILFLVLGAIYSMITPIFEAGDEVWHYPFVQYLATGHGLPVQDPEQTGLWEQEGGQPPLYYGLSAVATFWVDSSDLNERLWRNPFAKIGVPLAYGNKNIVVHTNAEQFPWGNTTLAVHLVRLISLVFGALTVLFTYILALELLRGRPIADQNPFQNSNGIVPLVAAALVAFNPMFLFISASVNNDSLAAALAALGLLLIVQLISRGMTTPRLVILGIVAGLAALTKVSNLALIPSALLVVGWITLRAHKPGQLLRVSILIALPALLLAGWWYARNWVLYGDPLGLNVWLQIAGGRPPVSVFGLVNEFQGLRISFWGNFGGVNLIAPEWVYVALDLISLLAAAGLLISAVRRSLPGLLLIPALWVLLIFAGLVRWTLMTYASQGRLLFPALSAVAVLLAFGLASLPLSNSRQVTWLVPSAALFLLISFAVVAPFLIISPAYALPARLDTNAYLPNPVHINYGPDNSGLELAGHMIDRSVRPGEELPVTLYWRTGREIDQDLYVYIHLYDAAGRQVGQWDALPGNGLYPTRLWRTGEIIVDRYRVPVSSDVRGPQVARVEAGLTPVSSSIPLAAHDPQGREIVPVIGQFKIAGPLPTQPPRAALYTFGDTFQTTRVQTSGRRGGRLFELGPGTRLFGGDLVRLELTLRAARSPSEDYHIFVHLLDPQGQIAGQADAPPLHGRFPTAFWDAGDEVADEFEVGVPDAATTGEYNLEFGMYQTRDSKRLPVSGDPLGNLHADGDRLLYTPILVGQ